MALIANRLPYEANMNRHSSHTEQRPVSSEMPNIIQISSLIYGTIAAIGLTLIHSTQPQISSVFQFKSQSFSAMQLLGIGMLSAGILICLSYFFEEFLPSYRAFRASVMQTLGRVSLLSAVYLAAISAIAEEILFRGGIQPSAGIMITSILFGLMHLGPDGRLSSWSIWAMNAGLLLGWTYDCTASLWPAMIAHFCVNVFGLLRLRMEYKKYLQARQNQDLTNAAKSS
jgi:membrane protease YdiL (CAAX protease family)